MIVTYVIIAIIVVILATWERSPFRIFWKSEAGKAFVRTGLGGPKSVIGGGAFVVPLLHKVQWVDLGEIRLLISRKNENSIITKDHLRVDIESEFYLRVKADKESVIQASIALGRRAQSSEALRDFLESNLLDALQAAGSEITLDEMHDNRVDFSRRIRELLVDDMRSKGLELTRVSLSSIDQTSLEFYDSDNVFDSLGLLTIKEQTESRRKVRNEIERSQSYLIEQKNVEIRKKLLELERERSFAEQDTRKEIESQREERDRELTQYRLDQRRMSQEAQITHDQIIREKELSKDQYVEEKRIIKEQTVELAEIQKQEDLEQKRILTEQIVQTAAISREINLAAEKRKKEETLIELERVIESIKINKDKHLDRERIAKELEIEMNEVAKANQIEEERINREKSEKITAIQSHIEQVRETEKFELAEMDKTKAVELAKRTRQVAIAAEERAIALARMEEAKARSDQEKAEQELISVKTTSQAERQRTVALIRADEDAGRKRIEVENQVALNAREIVQLATARLEGAQKDAKATEITSQATRIEALARAEGEQAMVEARNLISEHILKDERASQLIGQLAQIAHELMKPAEKIESIKVVNVDGMGSTFGRGITVDGDPEQSILSQAGSQSAIATIISGILQVGAFKPVFKQLLGEDGIAELDNERLMEILREITPGLLQNTGREVVRAALQEEQARKNELKKKEDKE